MTSTNQSFGAIGEGRRRGSFPPKGTKRRRCSRFVTHNEGSEHEAPRSARSRVKSSSGEVTKPETAKAPESPGIRQPGCEENRAVVGRGRHLRPAAPGGFAEHSPRPDFLGPRGCRGRDECAVGPYSSEAKVFKLNFGDLWRRLTISHDL